LADGQRAQVVRTALWEHARHGSQGGALQRHAHTHTGQASIHANVGRLGEAGGAEALLRAAKTAHLHTGMQQADMKTGGAYKRTQTQARYRVCVLPEGKRCGLRISTAELQRAEVCG